MVDLFNDIYQLKKNDVGDQVADEMALAYILDTFNSGIALLKQDANGNFLKLSTIASTNGSYIAYTQKMCN